MKATPIKGRSGTCPDCGRQFFVDGWDTTPDEGEEMELECRCGAKLKVRKRPNGTWQLRAEKRDEPHDHLG